MKRKAVLNVILGLAASVALLQSGETAHAAPYPEKPIRLVVPYAPGGGTDILSRIIGKRLSEIMGAQVVIENRGGAGGSIGTAIVAKSPPDGYTLVMATNATHAINPSLYSDPGYDAVKDFAPISLAASTPSVLVVSSSYPIKNVQELIAFIKKDGTTTYASAGPGSSAHLGAELFKSLTNVEVSHIPYKGAGPASIDLMAGRVTMMFDTLPASITNIRAGKLHVLGVSSKESVPELPGVPTISETVPGYEFESWYGVLAPSGTPPEIIQTLNQAVTKALEDEDVRSSLARMGLKAMSSTPQQFADRISQEIPKWKSIIETSGAKVD